VPALVHRLRVIFGDTDQMGVVYYANYLRYFEAARGEFLRAIGSSGKDLEVLGIGFPVTQAYARYRRSARYEDELDVELDLEEMGASRLKFAYQVRRADELLADGWTEHACIDSAGRPCRIPERLRTRLAAPIPVPPSAR
jgi:acyl-CoA thioester hydrolase